MRIRIGVQHQDACNVAGRGLHSTEGCISYFLVHDRGRWSDLDPNGKLVYAKLEEENGGLGD